MKVEQHGTSAHYTFAHTWLLVSNVHPYDHAKLDTCFISVFQCKPTERQVRSHRKQALKHKRRGGRYVPASWATGNN